LKLIGRAFLQTGVFSAGFSLVLSLVLFGAAFGQPRSPQPGEDPSKSPLMMVGAASACAQEVRNSLPGGSFDAYVTPRGKIRLFGSEQETLAFKQCMRQKGYPAPADSS
jgi:hypothetical protein